VIPYLNAFSRFQFIKDPVSFLQAAWKAHRHSCRKICVNALRDEARETRSSMAQAGDQRHWERRAEIKPSFEALRTKVIEILSFCPNQLRECGSPPVWCRHQVPKR